MGTTRKALRQGVLQDLGKCVLGTVDSATPTTITDDDLADTAASPEEHGGHWLYMASGALAGQERRVAGFGPSTGVLTLGRALSAAPTGGDEYELHALLSPGEVNRLINKALELCCYEHYEEIDVVSGSWQYPLAAYTWLTRPDQVWGVEWRYDVGTGQYRWLPMDWFEVNGNADALMLNIRPPTSSLGAKFRLWCIRPYAGLDTDDEETDCPWPWIEAALKYRIFEQLTYSEPAEDSKRYERQMVRWGAVLHERRKNYAPRPEGSVGFGERAWHTG